MITINGLKIVDCTSGVVENNNFTSNTETGILATRLPAGLTELELTSNRFTSNKLGGDFQKCSLDMSYNMFDNLDTGLLLDNCENSYIGYNTFNDITDDGISSTGSDDLIFTANELTNILGISLSAVKVRIHRARISFRDFIIKNGCKKLVDDYLCCCDEVE